MTSSHAEGRGSFRAQYPAVIQCKTAEERSHSIEIVLKDVAGLVPGAYQGRGKGNRFLDDVCEADVLIHIVDGSGNVDAQGHANGGGDPVSDIEWIYAEIHRWISDNVWAKWNNVTRALNNPHYGGKKKGANDAAWDTLCALFSGYRSLPRNSLVSALISIRCIQKPARSWKCGRVRNSIGR